MGWPLAARQLAGNLDSGLPTAAEELRVLCRPSVLDVQHRGKEEGGGFVVLEGE